MAKAGRGRAPGASGPASPAGFGAAQNHDTITAACLSAGGAGHTQKAVDGRREARKETRAKGGLWLNYNNVFGKANGEFGSMPPLRQEGSFPRDPLFVDRAGGSRRFQWGSPLVDRADDNVQDPLSVDPDRNPRLPGPRVDIGAYKLQLAVKPTVAGVV